MQEVLDNLLGGVSLPKKSVVRLTDRPDMTLDVYRGRKTTIQQQQQPSVIPSSTISNDFSETIKPIVTKFHIQPPGPLGKKNC